MLQAFLLVWTVCWPAIGQEQAVARGQEKTAVVDAWFNSQQRPDAAGKMEYFHYKWNDTTNSGFSLFGKVFNHQQSFIFSAIPRIRLIQ